MICDEQLKRVLGEVNGGALYKAFKYYGENAGGDGTITTAHDLTKAVAQTARERKYTQQGMLTAVYSHRTTPPHLSGGGWPLHRADRLDFVVCPSALKCN